MIDEEKQIEEMAEDIERARLKARGVNGSMNQGFGMWYAKTLWEMGYRRDESKCPLQCRNCKFSRMATDAERMGMGLELLVCEIRRNSDGNVYFVTPDHYCGHGEKEAGVSDA